MELNNKVKYWLLTHARSEEDLKADDDGLYVLMRKDRQDVKVYLPKRLWNNTF